MAPEYGLAVSAIIVALISAGGTVLALRLKAGGSESYEQRAAGDRTYKEIADDYSHQVDFLIRRLRAHDMRWRLVTDVLSYCVTCPVGIPGQVRDQIEQLRVLNGLAEIDDVRPRD